MGILESAQKHFKDIGIQYLDVPEWPNAQNKPERIWFKRMTPADQVAIQKLVLGLNLYAVEFSIDFGKGTLSVRDVKYREFRPSPGIYRIFGGFSV